MKISYCTLSFISKMYGTKYVTRFRVSYNANYKSVLFSPVIIIVWAYMISYFTKLVLGYKYHIF